MVFDRIVSLIVCILLRDLFIKRIFYFKILVVFEWFLVIFLRGSRMLIVDLRIVWDFRGGFVFVVVFFLLVVGVNGF